MYSESSSHSSKLPRVLHLVHGLNRGGIETWLLSTLQTMPRNEYIMDVSYKGPYEGELASSVRATGAKLLHCPLGPLVLPFVQRMKVMLQRGSYSLLHVHTDAHSGPAVHAANAVGVPVVTTFHSTEQPPRTQLTRLPGVRTARTVYARHSMRYALLHSTVASGVSNTVCQAVTSTAQVPVHHCEVLRLGCVRPEPNTVQRTGEYQRELHLPNDAQVVVHVGNFRAGKNHLCLLQAFRKIADAVPEAVLLLVGDGELRPTIEEQVRQLRLERSVRLLGKRSDATSLMQLGELFVFPSHNEGLSVAMMEANALGLPIVASDIAGNREATDGGASARLHGSTDVEGLASSAIELLRNPLERRRLAKRGREIYEHTFSIEASVTRLKSLYGRVLAAHTSPQSVNCGDKDILHRVA